LNKFIVAAVMGMFSSMAMAAEDASDISPVMVDMKTTPSYLDDPVKEDVKSGGKDRTGLSIKATGSTLGAGAEFGYRVNDHFGFRVPFGKGDASFDGDVDGYDVEGDMKFGGIGLLLDYYPWKGAFHLSGGAFKTDYSASGIARDVTIQSHTTDVMLDVSQKRDFAPAIAMGWDFQIGKHGMFSADIGAMFGSGFDLKSTESSGMAPQNLVDAEFEDVRNDLGDIKVLPYLKVGVGFKF
jgi:hypothetical protein